MKRHVVKVLVIPAHNRDVINAKLARHGYGPDNFSIPLYKNGVITHYSCSVALNSCIEKAFQKATGKDCEKFGSIKEVCMAKNLVLAN